MALSLRSRSRQLVSVIREVFREFSRDDCVTMAGSLAFFTLFSFPPILLIVVDLAGLLVDPEIARAEILSLSYEIAGATAREQTRAVLDAVGTPATTSLAGTIASLAMLLFAATMVLAQTQQALNRVWGVVHRSGGLKHFLVRRVISFAMILGLVVLLLLSLASSAVLAVLGDQIAAVFPAGWTGPLLTAATAGIYYALVSLVLVLVFKLLPEAKVPWSDAIPGALLTGLLLGGGREVIGWVLTQLSLGSAFGAAQSLAILLFWVFYSSAILLWGAELTKVMARRRGHRVEPEAGAVRAPKS